MKAEIITVGTELLLGDIVNSNSQFLSKELAAFGIEVLYQSTVGDNMERLEQLLTTARSRSDMVLITGGLGPTDDDLTKETVCKVLHFRLALHEESWQRIQDYFASTGKPMTENNKKQAMLPEGCVVFPNDHGTAPGCAVERYGQHFILLPGPPRELIPMFHQYVAPYLAELSGGIIQSYTIGVFGLPEAAIAERLADLMAGANPSVAPYAKEGEVMLRVTAKATDAETAAALCQPVIEEIRNRLGAYIYGVNAGSLQKTVVNLLVEKGLKVATAESCTAGILSGRITEVPGASQVFECGIAAYSKEIKHQVLGVPMDLLEQQGTISSDVASAMAVGVRRVSGADLGIGITGVAGPEPSENKPVGTVYIALADDKRVWVKEIMAGHDDREHVRYIATSHALDMTRRYLEALPGVMAGGQLIESEPQKVQIPKSPPTGRRGCLPSILPWKGDSGGTIIRKLLVMLLVLALLAGGALLFYLRFWYPGVNRSEYAALANLYQKDQYQPVSSPYMPYGMLAQFQLLYLRNPDIRGFIQIEGTNIKYPVVQNSAVDYTKINFSGERSPYGVPFFDPNVVFTETSSYITCYIIHGNNPGDGQMFSDLLRYTDAAFFLAHPVIQMDTLYRTGKWQVFGVMYVDDNDPSFNYRQTTFVNQEEYANYLAELQKRSLFTGIEVGVQDRLLLLTTPVNDRERPGLRLVVMARLLPENVTTVESVPIYANHSALMPGQTASTTVTTPTSQYVGGGVDNGSEGNTQPSNSSDELPDLIFPEPEDTAPPSTTQSSAPPKSTGSTGGASTTTIASSGPSTKTNVPSTTTAPQTSSTTATQTSTAPAATTTTKPAVDSPEAAYYRTIQVKIGNGQPFYIESKEQLQYVLACVTKVEMGSARMMANSTEAQKAQAVAAYSYMLWYCNTQKQVFTISNVSINLDNPTDKKIYDAVGQVLGVKIINVGKSSIAAQACNTMYFSSAYQATASCQNVYSTALPYLQSVKTEYDTPEIVSKYSGGTNSLITKYSITFANLKTILNQYVAQQTGGKATTVEFEQLPSTPFGPVTYDSGTGYVVNTNCYYILNGKKVYLRGIDIRKAIGTSTLRSHNFTVAYNQADDTLTFTVYGHGHGLGMSQYGAVGYANEAGWNYEQILKLYYSITPNSPHQLVQPEW